MQGEGGQSGGDTGKTAQLNLLSCEGKINVMSLFHFLYQQFISHYIQTKGLWTPDNYTQMWVFPQMIARKLNHTIVQDVFCLM